jgi:hypothetical protein
MSNVAVLREVAGGLQKLALESLSLRDEVRRYLDTWIQNQRRAAAGTTAPPPESGGRDHE